MSLPFDEYKYAPPSVGSARFRMRCVALRAAELMKRASRRAIRITHGIANRLSRPRCVYPGCQGDIANWMRDEDGYAPVDSDLCETHHKAQSETIRVFYMSDSWKSSDLANTLASAERVSQAWAKWHAGRMTK